MHRYEKTLTPPLVCICSLLGILNPRFLFGRETLKTLVSKKIDFRGAIDMLDLAGPFLFGGGFSKSSTNRPFGEELYSILENPSLEQEEKLWEYIRAVQARSLEDAVAKELEEFVRCWMALKSDMFEPWVQLDATCRLREDVDLC